MEYGFGLASRRCSSKPARCTASTRAVGRNKISSTGKSPDQNSPITGHPAYLLAQANREINRQFEERLGKEGVPVEQWRILKVLSDANGRSMGEFADAVLLNHPTLTKMIDRMVSDALVHRVPAASC
jgi:hypothetical protein